MWKIHKGMLCIEISNRSSPFRQFKTPTELFKALDEDNDLPEKQLSASCAPLLKSIVSWCCSFSPIARPSMEDLVKFTVRFSGESTLPPQKGLRRLEIIDTESIKENNHPGNNKETIHPENKQDLPEATDPSLDESVGYADTESEWLASLMSVTPTSEAACGFYQTARELNEFDDASTREAVNKTLFHFGLLKIPPSVHSFHKPIKELAQRVTHMRTMNTVKESTLATNEYRFLVHGLAGYGKMVVIDALVRDFYDRRGLNMEVIHEDYPEDHFVREGDVYNAHRKQRSLPTVYSFKAPEINATVRFMKTRGNDSPAFLKSSSAKEWVSKIVEFQPQCILYCMATNAGDGSRLAEDPQRLQMAAKELYWLTNQRGLRKLDLFNHIVFVMTRCSETSFGSIIPSTSDRTEESGRQISYNFSVALPKVKASLFEDIVVVPASDAMHPILAAEDTLPWRFTLWKAMMSSVGCVEHIDRFLELFVLNPPPRDDRLLDRVSVEAGWKSEKTQTGSMAKRMLRFGRKLRN